MLTHHKYKNIAADTVKIALKELIKYLSWFEHDYSIRCYSHGWTMERDQKRWKSFSWKLPGIDLES